MWWVLWLMLAGCEGEGSRGFEDDPSTACNEANEGCEPGRCGGDGGQMLPGADCLACHTEGNMEEDEQEALFSFAGTVYVDEDGTAPLQGATVRLTDANDQVIELTSNAAGNFFSTAAVTLPAEVEIETDGGVSHMMAPLLRGGCNECHACEGVAEGKLYGL